MATSTDPAIAAVVALVAVIKAIIAMLVAVAVVTAASVTLSSWDIHSGTLKMICVVLCTFLISWCFWRCVTLLYFRVVYRIEAFVLRLAIRTEIEL